MSADISRFLAAFPTEPYFHLTAINDKGVVGGGTLPADDNLAEKVSARAQRMNTTANVYFSVNAPSSANSRDKTDRKARKLDKGHIGTLRAVWADLDPLDALEVLPSDDPDNPAMTGRVKEKLRLVGLAEAVQESDFPPSAAIDSGNGVQLIWFFDEPIDCTDETREKVEAIGHRIETALGGTENTANIDRVLRLPGTTNKPGKKKRDLGRVEMPATLLYVTEQRYGFGTLGEMAAAFETEIAPELVKAGHIIHETPAEHKPEPEVEFDEDLPPKLLALLHANSKLRACWTKGAKLGKGKDTSASGLDMSLTLYLCRKLDNAALALALRAFPHGQIGNGTKKGEAAERRIAQLLKIADERRDAAQHDGTQDGIAQAFADTHEDRVRYCFTAGKWFVFSGNLWRRDETDQCFSWVRRIGRNLGFDGKASTASGAEKFARCDERLAVTHEAWDPDPFLLGTPEGIVDLRHGTMRKARPDDMVTRSTSVAPKRGPHPLWSAFLDDATRGDKEYQRFLQQAAGYCLTGDTREHALFFICGDGGNGKSVFLNVLTGILNEYAKTAAMTTFMASSSDSHPTDLAMLNGARLVTASETEEGKPWAESRIKQMTGGDPITARFMRKDFFTFVPEFKPMIIGNKKPALKSVDDAVRRRFNILPFVYKPERPDRLLGTKLVAEYPAILAWMIEGCLDWQRNGLVRPKVVTDATHQYFEDQDIFGQWLEECCAMHDTFSEAGGMVFSSWRKWCDARGLRPGDNTAFGENMRRNGFERFRPARTNGTRPPYHWKGLTLTAEARADVSGGFGTPYDDDDVEHANGWSATV